MDRLWLIQLIFITGSWIESRSSSPCPVDQFLHVDGFCCEFCPIETFMYKPCLSNGTESLCFHCHEKETFMDEVQHNLTSCKQCSVCDPESEVEERDCNFMTNRQCVCREGLHRKGNECVMEGESVIPSHIWISVSLLIGFLLISLLIFLFVQRRRLRRNKVVEACARFLKSGKSSTVLVSLRRGEVTNILEEILGAKGLVEHCSSSLTSTEGQVEYPEMVELDRNNLRSRYGRTPSLDPNSAHRGIKISQNLRTATRTGTKHRYPKHPDRFDYFPQVVSCESFSSGRHYWEVDVRSSSLCEIGICLNSMRRKGEGSECRLGGNPQSWCLLKYNNKYYAHHNKQVTPLSVSGNPERFGFFLDCEAGELTCFGDSRVLHVFRGNFTDPVKPAFGVYIPDDSVWFL